jgi:hypothetical protein
MSSTLTAPVTNSTHRWKFFRAGGLDQVLLESGADLLALDTLDQKLWVALSCPTKGLEFDPKTLALIDADKDGRIRAPELIAAIKWAGARLKNPDVLVDPGDGLPLSAIDDRAPEGIALLASARRMLVDLGKADSATITVADTADTAKFFALTRLNGDGIVPADAAEDEALKKVINEIIDCLGAETDRSGKPGVNQAKVDQFFTALQGFLDWWQAGERHASSAEVLPLGTDTPAGDEALKAVKAKIDDFFARCRLAAYDARAVAHLNRPDSEYVALAAKDLSALAPEVAALPLAQIAAGRALPLVDGLNPAWSEAMAAFRTKVVVPLLGAKTELTETEWRALVARFAAYEKWAGAKAGSEIEKLGLPRIRELLASKHREELTQLIDADLALSGELSAIDDLDRLVRYQRDLNHLVNNFVSFTDFYSPTKLAIFQAGTLYLDGRSCELCIEVADPAAHAALGSLGKCYLAYCDLKRSNGEARKVVCVFSNGDSDYLMVGRNGIFYDRKGRDWDATIVRVVENPISVRQAFWSPYKKFVRMIEEQVAKRAAAAEARSDSKLAGAADNVAHADQKAATPAAGPKKIDVGIVAALGVAISGAVTALTLILGYIFGLKWWQYPLVLVGLMLVISLPSMLIAWLKLRQRTLGPILDANGWAINGRVKINLPLGSKLTRVAHLPAGAQRSLDDPYEDKEAAARARRIKLWLVVLILVGGAFWVRYHHDQRGGYYFWQKIPPAEAGPEAPPAPAGEEAPAGG